ncbi:MAG: hypothetical protein C0483_10385 [Pirellula sp.]|nr:hypothetical protein [Pirellula sp.]
MALFPLYAVTESTRQANPYEQRIASVWNTAVFEDGSQAMLVWYSRESAVESCGLENISVVMIESAYKFAAALKNFVGEGQPTKVCWNLRRDGSFDQVATIADTMEFLANLPPEAKGS